MAFEVEFLPVGDSNGDAICVRYGDSISGLTVHVIDGGMLATAEVIIEHIEAFYGRDATIDHMVLSHADNDHATGLVEVMRRFPVRTLWMNRPWLYAANCIDSFHGNYTVAGLVARLRELHPYLVDLENLAAIKGASIREAFQGARIGCFTVLAPSKERYISLIPHLEKSPPSYASTRGLFARVTEAAKEAVSSIFEDWHIETLDKNPPMTSASNETSIVQIADFDDRTYLLTADVGPSGLTEAALYASSIGLLRSPFVVQVPHHGSRRNVTPEVLDWWLGTALPQGAEPRGTAFVSIGKNADIYPRKKVKNAFIRRGYPVIATRGAAKSSTFGFMPRAGWIAASPEPFSHSVED